MNWQAAFRCCLLALALPASHVVHAAPASSTPASELAGLWTAKRWFGPFARAHLVIRRTGSSYTADMLGHEIPVRVERDELEFVVPGEQGTFRGKLDRGGALRGHWYPGDGRHVSPVHFRRDGPNRWSGEVEPVEDTFTFHLFVREGRGDTLEAMLNNPEQNYGGWLLGVKRLVREGEVVKLIGKLPWQSSESVVTQGSFDPETRTITLAFPARRGSYDFRRDDEHSAFYPRGRSPGKYIYHPPLTRDDGWPTGTLEQVGIDRRGVERLVQMLLDAPMDSASTPRVHALLIARHGRLVLEEYFHGEHRDKLHDTRSASKSVTAVVVGAALREGALSLSTPVYQIMNGGSFAPELDPRKRSMTLEHLLTMSSGYFCDDTNPEAPGNEDKMQEQTVEPDYYRYTLNVPMATTPGEKAVYCSASPNLALAMVGSAIAESPLHLFDRVIATPMQIRRYGWGIDPAENLYGGGGMRFMPRDFLKFGQLMLDGGTWRGHRILEPEFAKRASSPLYHLRGRVYGYLWWGADYPYKDRSVHAFYAGGNGGQSVIVFPELDLVVSSFGGNYNTSAGTFYVQMTVTPRDLLPCVRERGDDPKEPVVPRQDYTPKLGPRDEAGPITGR